MDHREPSRPDDASHADDAVDFDAVIDDVLEDLPDPFLEQLGSVAIVVEDEATPDQLGVGPGAAACSACTRAFRGHGSASTTSRSRARSRCSAGH